MSAIRVAAVCWLAFFLVPLAVAEQSEANVAAGGSSQQMECAGSAFAGSSGSGTTTIGATRTTRSTSDGGPTSTTGGSGGSSGSTTTSTSSSAGGGGSASSASSASSSGSSANSGATACTSSSDRTIIIAGSVAGVGGAGLAWLGWVAWLRWLPLMGGFTRLRKNTLLDHPARAHLHQVIEEEPGIHFQALRDRTGLANGQASHHLAMMVRGGLLNTVRARGYATYFVHGTVDAPVMEALVAVRSPTAVEILRAVAAAPGAGTRSLAQNLGRAESTVRHHATRLRAVGVLHGDMQVSTMGERVMAFIPDGVGRPRRPPGPAQ